VAVVASQEVTGMRTVLKFLLMSSLLALTAASSVAAQLTTGLNLGHAMAPGAELTAEVAGFAEGMPFSLRAGVGYAQPDGGDAVAARRVFINDATNGTPESSGKAWSGRLDLVREFDHSLLDGARVYAGPRFAAFTGNFNYVGGNEDFDVRSNHWGWGGGLEWRWPVGDTMNFSLGGGADWYLAARMQGHDTAYEPEGEAGTERGDYRYEDADEAINQPTLEWRIGLGLSRSFGG
jgi:hypothetical protein